MLTNDEMARIREEQEALETWRKVSRHVVAEMIEACAVCGTVRDKDRLTQCRWCADIYCCKEGLCTHRHQAETHPAVAFWTW